MKHNIIQHPEDLPMIPQKIHRLYLDFETTSYHRARTSLNPWKHCWIAGAAFTWDEMPQAFYLPLGHDDSCSAEENFNEENGLKYLQALFEHTEIWVNHNVKYDALVAYNAGLNFWDCTLFDTLTQAKLIQSDLFNYTEEHLAKKWLGHEDTGRFKTDMMPWINRQSKNRDWGQIPIRVMGPYACNDVHENRDIDIFIDENMPEDVRFVSENEVLCTKAILKAEINGVNIDQTQCKVAQYQTLRRMSEIVDEIRDATGYFFRPSENPDCLAIFNGEMGLPIVRYTGDDPTDPDGGEPSYDKYALATLRQYPNAPIDLIDMCLEYRQHSSNNGYVEALLTKNIDGCIHSSYNQSVRTGRMSCRDPNNQQWNAFIKSLIIPGKDRVIVNLDYSSVEFRIIAHYLSQPEIMARYAEDPDADFHQIVADMCRIERKPAKNINFAMAFAGGKKKVLQMLANDASIIRDIKADSPEEFTAMCFLHAEGVYNTYHRMMYRLRPLTKMAASRLVGRGYVRNQYGRHRHLPKQASYRAFNTVVQSGAADLMKQAVVGTSSVYNKFLADHDVQQIAYVHDALVFTMPKDLAPAGQIQQDKEGKEFIEYCDQSSPVMEEIVKQMLKPGDAYTIPMRVDAEVCPKSWGRGIKLPKDLLYGDYNARQIEAPY